MKLKAFFLTGLTSNGKSNSPNNFGDDILMLRQIWLVVKFVITLLLKTVGLAFRGLRDFFLSLFFVSTWTFFFSKVFFNVRYFQQAIQIRLLLLTKAVLQFIYSCPRKWRLVRFVVSIWTKQRLQHIRRVVIILFYYPFIHLLAVVLILKSFNMFRGLYAPRNKRLFSTIRERLTDFFYGLRLIFTFTYTSVVIRLVDNKLPEAVEMGYPLSWYDKAKLCEAMYQNNGFFFWTLTENVNSQVIMNLNKFHQLPLYLDGGKLEFANVPEFLKYLKGQFQQDEVPYVFSETLYLDLYSTFLDHFKLVLLDELKKDPFAVIRANLVDYHVLDQTNLYDQYAYTTHFGSNLLDRVFGRWEVSFDTEMVNTDIISIANKTPAPKLTHLRTSEDLILYFSNKKLIGYYEKELNCNIRGYKENKGRIKKHFK
jgi:hypothetical protein